MYDWSQGLNKRLILLLTFEPYSCKSLIQIMQMYMMNFLHHYSSHSLLWWVSCSRLPLLFHTLCSCLPPTYPNCDDVTAAQSRTQKPLLPPLHLLFTFLNEREARRKKERKACVCVMASGGDRERCLGASSRPCPQHHSPQRTRASHRLQHFSAASDTHSHKHTFSSATLFSLH